MCELLFSVRDLGQTGNIAIDSRRPKQGDVIMRQPDGWPWGRCELGVVVPGNPNGNHPFFRIVKFPNVTLGQAGNLITGEADVDPLNPSPYLQYRARFLDISKIVPATMRALLDHWNDDTRANSFISLALNSGQLNGIISVRPPVLF